MNTTGIYTDRIAYPVIDILGPGARWVMWMQGCTHNCPGCISPELAERKAESYYKIEDIINLIPIDENLDGITISGGEPFQQAEGLSIFVEKVRKDTDFDIMVYSGYKIQEIKNGTQAQRDLLSKIDILVDGKYDQNFSNKKIWRGSDNQKVHLLTDRVQKYKQAFQREYTENRKILFQKGDNGVYLIGIPDRKFNKNFKERCKKSGVILEN